ncbi:hypothetical protein EDD15DRAFT_2191567 [Pisolithus albus]|nr:hypothetical protein EDD15DRAFT_2191567 [Pisolithus albus]
MHIPPDFLQFFCVFLTSTNAEKCQSMNSVSINDTSGTSCGSAEHDLLIMEGLCEQQSESSQHYGKDLHLICAVAMLKKGSLPNFVWRCKFFVELHRTACTSLFTFAGWQPFIQVQNVHNLTLVFRHVALMTTVFVVTVQ